MIDEYCFRVRGTPRHPASTRPLEGLRGPNRGDRYHAFDARDKPLRSHRVSFIRRLADRARAGRSKVRNEMRYTVQRDGALWEKNLDTTARLAVVRRSSSD